MMILTFQMTWSRLAEGSTPYTVLTIGDTKYINNERFAIEKPIRHDVSVAISFFMLGTRMGFQQTI